MYTFTADGILTVDDTSLPRSLWQLCTAAWRAMSALVSVIWVEFLCLIDQWAHDKLSASAEQEGGTS